jgi:hypothetical protein
MKNLHMIKAKTTQKKKNPTKKQPKKTSHEFKDKMKQRGQCHNEQLATENLHSNA